MTAATCISLTRLRAAEAVSLADSARLLASSVTDRILWLVRTVLVAFRVTFLTPERLLKRMVCRCHTGLAER